MSNSSQTPSPTPTKPKGINAFFVGLFFSFLKLVALLPYPVLRGLGKLIGKLLYRVKKRRFIVEANLRYCFPQLSLEQRHTLCREHFASLGIGMIELAMAWYKPLKSLQKHHEIKGLEHYEKAQADGRGILFLGYHITSLEMAGALMSQYLDFAAFYRPNKNKAIDYHIQKGRNNRSKTMARSDIRSIGKWLKSGQNLWLMPDQDMGKKGSVFAPFFGNPTSTLTSPMRIAKLGNAIVLPISYHKDSKGKMILEVLPELKFSGDDMVDCTQINQLLETSINKGPENYYWVHRRFKTLPEGQRSIYLNKNLKPVAVNAEQHDGALYSGKILARAKGLPKLVRTLDGQMLNSFARHTSFGIEITQKEIQRMLEKINQFNFRGFYSISPNEFTYCAERQAYMLRYNELPGVSISSIEPAQQDALAILLGSWLGQLHREGIALNAFKASNIELLPNKNFALLNPVQCEFFDKAVSAKKANKDIELLFQEIAFLQQEASASLFKKQYAKTIA